MKQIFVIAVIAIIASANIANSFFSDEAYIGLADIESLAISENINREIVVGETQRVEEAIALKCTNTDCGAYHTVCKGSGRIRCTPTTCREKH